MCEIDLEPCDVFTTTTRRARKAHRCESCDGVILAGATYVVVFMVQDGDASSEKVCGACDAAMTEFAAADGHTRCNPSHFPEMLENCVDARDPRDPWRPMLDALRARRRPTYDDRSPPFAEAT